MNNKSTTPEAFVCLGKSRLPVYKSGKVFMKAGAEFQLEFFNPTNKTVGAKIYLNGEPVSNSMLVIRPGQRVYLDRYLDTKRKFKFATYEVDGGDASVKQAIKSNGSVRVEFFPEREVTYPPISNPLVVTPWTLPYQQPYIQPYNPLNPQPYFYGWSGTTGGNTFGTLLNGNSCCTVNANLSGTTVSNGDGITLTSGSYKTNLTQEEVVCDSIETGRTEMGSASSQSLQNVDFDFDWMYSNSMDYHIFPESRKPMEAGDIRSYCECSRRIRKGERFCPSCGTKIS